MGVIVEEPAALAVGAAAVVEAVAPSQGVQVAAGVGAVEAMPEAMPDATPEMLAIMEAAVWTVEPTVQPCLVTVGVAERLRPVHVVLASSVTAASAAGERAAVAVVLAVLV